MEFKPKMILDVLENGLGNEQGDLTLLIGCTKCPALFELNRDSATMAIGFEVTFLEYLRYVQASKCPKCAEKNDN